MPTAPLALVPSLETKKVSAVLYIAVTSILITVGTASFMTSPGTGAVVILRCCALFKSVTRSFIWYPASHISVSEQNTQSG